MVIRPPYKKMETKRIITPNGIEAEIKEWISVKEKEAIERPFKKYKMVIDQGKFEKVEVDVADISDESKKIAIETIVLSLEGSAENIYDRIMDMRAEDGQFILAAVDHVASGKGFTPAASNQEDGIDAAN